MKKRKTQTLGTLIPSAMKSADGLHELEAVLMVAQNTEAKMRGDIDSVTKAQNEYRAAIDAALAAYVAQRNTVLLVADYLSYTRDVLKREIGARYSEAWGSAGFTNGSLSLPRTLDGRVGLLQSVEGYFEGHPDAEVAEINVTGARATELRGLLLANVATVNKAGTTRRQKKAVRDAAVAALRKRMQGLRAELKQLMPKDDPRWLEFGLDVPADASVPAAPEGPTVALNALGHLVASWAHTVNAVRYRVYKRVAGVDTEYVPVDSTTDTSFDLGVFASGAHVDVRVTAINTAGESVPSETASAVVP